MTRIPPVPRGEAQGSVREAFDRVLAERGSLPELYRVAAHRPWILSTLDAHFAAVMGSGTLPVRLKEMLAAQTSLVNGCRSAARDHAGRARRAGATEEQTARLLDCEKGPFDDREKAALRFALQMARDAAGVGESRLTNLRQHFQDGEIVEIACVVGLVGYLNRFTQALCDDVVEGKP
jgi:uncharacterized peroxidase-related enzyme